MADGKEVPLDDWCTEDEAYNLATQHYRMVFEHWVASCPEGEITARLRFLAERFRDMAGHADRGAEMIESGEIRSVETGGGSDDD